MPDVAQSPGIGLIVPKIGQSMPSSPDPSDLLIFARVVEAGSFSAAAVRLGLPKSTVSRRITVLEKKLGERLLQRTTRRNVLTEMGQRILGPAEQIAHEVDRALAVAEHRQLVPTGRLRVSVPADFAAISLAPMISDFVASYSELQLDLDLSPRYVDVIAEGFDLAIRVGADTQDQRLTTRHLIDLGVSLYASPSYIERKGRPAAPDSLAQHDKLVLVGGGTPVSWPLSKLGETIVADLAGRRVTANTYEVLFRLARLGAGISAIPDQFAEPFVQRGELERVLPNWALPTATVRAMFPSRQLMPRKTRVFLDSLLAYLRPASVNPPAFLAALPRGEPHIE
jgi:DNA-binding transcriptional LysR family regulator